MKRLLGIATILLLAGCASTPLEQEPAKTEPAAPVEPVTPAVEAAAPAPAEAAQAFAQAVRLLEENRLPEAEQELKQLTAAFPQFAGPHINLGLLYERGGKLEAALASLQEAVRIAPGNALAQTELGLVHRKLGKFKEAQAAYEKAIEADANYAPAYLNLGVLYDLYLQEPRRALEAFERYQQLRAPADPDLSANSDDPMSKQVANWIAELKGRLGSNAAPVPEAP